VHFLISDEPSAVANSTTNLTIITISRPPGGARGVSQRQRTINLTYKERK
jgi:hypothetical protein